MKTSSLRLAAIASTVATGWHFDAVIADIDKMITALREEEKADIERREKELRMYELETKKLRNDLERREIESKKRAA